MDNYIRYQAPKGEEGEGCGRGSISAGEERQQLPFMMVCLSVLFVIPVLRKRVDTA